MLNLFKRIKKLKIKETKKESMDVRLGIHNCERFQHIPDFGKDSVHFKLTRMIEGGYDAWISNLTINDRILIERIKK